MKRLILTLPMLAVALWMMAQTVVVDAGGEAMTGAVVMDNDGDPICIVDEQGRFPQVKMSLYPLTVTCMGFDKARVALPTDTVVMQPSAYQLGEVAVSPGERPGMYVVCYIRETSCMTDGLDSINIVSEYMADYMLPAFKGAKCKTWSSPRVLTDRRHLRYTMEQAPDESDINFMQFYSIFSSLDNKPVELPDSLKGCSQGSIASMGKHGCETIYRLNPSGFSVTKDALAGRKDHRLGVPLVAIFGYSMDITDFWTQQVYAPSESGVYGMANTVGIAYSLKVEGRGKGWKKMFPNDRLPVILHTYIEIFPEEIRYLTKDEAKEMKADKPRVEMHAPQAAK